jgi:quinoprotein glucose dehydrogenase
MKMKVVISFFACYSLLTGIVTAAPPQQDEIPAFKTVWDGVYTKAQAERGKEWADAHCIECHGETLGGGSAPPLHGPRWMELWREGGLDNLFNYIRLSMPAERPKEDLTDNSYLDIIAYMLELNDMPPGPQELTKQPLWTIMIQSQEGPKPVPSQAPVLTVGCLLQNADGSWALTNALTPTRSKALDETNPLEVSAYSARPAGDLTFRLPNASSYKADSHKGQRVFVKGVLGRQTAGDRINVTLMQNAPGTCQ